MVRLNMYTFYARSHFMVPRNRHANFSNLCLEYFKTEIAQYKIYSFSCVLGEVKNDYTVMF